MPSMSFSSMSITDPMGPTQELMEQAYAKFQAIPQIKEYMLSLGVEEKFKVRGIDPDFGVGFLVQMALQKKAVPSAIIGALKHHFKDWANPAQATAEGVEQLVNQGLATWDGQMLTVAVPIPGALQDKIDTYQYPLPMVHEPREIHHNRQTGYRSIPGSMILKDNHHDEDINLEHINRINKIPLKINANVLAFVKNRWRGLDKRKPDETPADFRKRQQAFEKFDLVARGSLKELMVATDRMFMTNRYDKRGRTYAQGYHINPQGNDWNKACIEFADKEPLT